MNNSEFSQFVDDYFEAAFETNPSWGTAAGFHEYDARLNDVSRAAAGRRIVQLKEFQVRLDRLVQGPLESDDTIDAEILSHQIQAELLDLEILRTWVRNPMGYVSLPGSAIERQ